MEPRLTPLAPIGALHTPPPTPPVHQTPPASNARAAGDFNRRTSDQGRGGAVDQDVANTETEASPPAPSQLLAAELRIEVDAEARRFVQSYSDPQTGEEIRQYPAEAQLAFSRAAGAFAKAQSDSSR